MNAIIRIHINLMKVRNIFACAGVLVVFLFSGFEAVASPWTETPKKVLCLRLDVTPATGTPYSQADLMNFMMGTSNSIQEMSYGITWVVPTVSSQVLPLPHDANYYRINPNNLIPDLWTAATNSGYNLVDYDFFAFSYPVIGGGAFTGGAYGVPGKVEMRFEGNQELSTFVHETGHAYGLGHAGFWRALTGSGYFGHLMHTNFENRKIEFTPYGDPFDPMAVNFRTQSDGTRLFPAGHFSMFAKAYLNWIKPEEVITVVTNGIYRVYRFDHKDARANAGTHLALQIPLPDRNPEQIWVGFRRNFTNPYSIYSGAYIVWLQNLNPNYHISLNAEPLVHPDSPMNVFEEESALPQRRSYTDPSGSIRITTLAEGGTSPYEYLDVQVEFMPPAMELFTNANKTVSGLVGSYVDQSLRGRTNQENWLNNSAIPIAGTRVDNHINFVSSSWGVRNTVGLTGGSDADWNNFSVQWDGVLVVNRPVLLGTFSDDSSRLWVDLNGDNVFDSSGPEFVNNHWGNAQAETLGDISQVIPAGTYRIRIQYEEGDGANLFRLVWSEAQFDLIPSLGSTAPGLLGTYVNRSLRATNVVDWRGVAGITVSGTRQDSYPGFYPNGWGLRSEVGLTNGSDDNWGEFSVQWDGYVRVYQPTRFTTISDDGCRLWIDLNQDGNFNLTGPELTDNHWGQAQASTVGDISTIVRPGTYKMRIQHEDTGLNSAFLLFGAPVQMPSTNAAVDAGLRVYDGANTIRIATEFPGTSNYLVSPLQINKNGTNYGVFLADPTAPGASKVRIQTSSGIKTLIKLP